MRAATPAQATPAAQAYLRRLCLAFLAASLAACDPGGTSTLRIVTPGAPGVLFQTGDDSVYPARLMRAATAEGLVAFDPQGRVVPALADRWIVLDDGQSYIFRLRAGTWKDGAPLTGASAQGALRAAIARLRGTAFALDLAVIDDVRVMAGRVVEIRLRQPMPDLLQLLAQPELGLIHRATSAGPMQLRREGDSAELTAIAPERLGLPAIAQWAARTRALRLSAMDGALAVRLFARGDADVMLGGRMQQFPMLGALGVARGAVRLDPVTGLFGLAVMPAGADGFLATVDNREALALAIDRDALIAAFNVAGWAGTTRVVPAAVENAPDAAPERWIGEPIAQRQARARAVVSRWQADRGQADRSQADRSQSGGIRAGGVQTGPTVRIALPPGPGSAIVFARLKTDFATIGVTALLVTANDIAAKGANLKGRADLVLLDQVARYPRPAWFLNRLACRVQHAMCDEGADALMETVRRTEDAPTRQRLLAEAEASLVAANVFIPIAAPLRFSLVSGDIGGGSSPGFATNPIGWHPLMPMALTPK